MLRRLPIRMRVTAAFTVAMAIVLTTLGLLVHARFTSDLDASIERGLRSRAADVAALVQQIDPSGSTTPLAARGIGVAQLLGPTGRVLDATAAGGSRPLLDRATVVQVRRGEVVRDVAALADDERIRLLAVPVVGDEVAAGTVAVVGTSLEERDDALEFLEGLLLLGLPASLLLAGLAGYGASTVALRPVERMRREAAEIAAGSPSRLAVPEADDELHRLGSTLNAMLDRLDAAFTRERRFVADASHELRTPLAILKAEIELALRAGREPHELRAALVSAGEETDRLARMAEDLLVIARADAGRLPVRLAYVDAGDLLEAVRARYAARASALGRDIVVVARDGVLLAADAERLQQALGNLVDNALRHGAGTVTLTASATPDGARIAVGDEGPGFAPAFLPEAFERFTRVDAGRGDGGGAGLGLALVAAVAQAHGGRAEAHDATVALALPHGTPS